MAPLKIRACLFDMDGLLINSEDLITVCINEILSSYGKPALPWSVKSQMQGRTLHDASEILLNWARLPLSAAEYQAELKRLHQVHFPTCAPLPGVRELVQNLARNPDVYLALATSSTREKFKLKTSHLTDIFAVFPESHRVFGDDKRIPPGGHKPAPDIYEIALRCINDLLPTSVVPIAPQECLVLEDSVPGVISGRRAGMHVLWCPHPDLAMELEQQAGSLVDAVASQLDNSPSQNAVADPDDAGTDLSQPSVTVVRSLSDFDYHLFGIDLLQAK